MATPQRLQRFLASAGVSSRRAGEKLIEAGRISVNGEVVTELGTKVNPEADVVRVDGVRVNVQKKKLYLFHKPAGIVTTLEDPHGRPCLTQFIKTLPARVFPVGRLDYDVYGLLLLTNDGEYANSLLHPRFGITRRYLAEVRSTPTAETLKRLCSGVTLDDGPGHARSASIFSDQSISGRLFPEAEGVIVDISVGEGRNHFVKRILAEVGHPVLRLCRIEFGPYHLGDLESGQLKELYDWNQKSVSTDKDGN